MQIVTFERQARRQLGREPGPGSMVAASLGFETLEGVRGIRRLGALLTEGPHAGSAVDLNRALAVKLASDDAGAPDAEADSLLPADALHFLGSWPRTRDTARATLDFVLSALEEYDAPDLAAAGIVTPRREVRLAAPVPRPGKIVAIDPDTDGPTLVAPSAIAGPEDEIRIPRGATLATGAALVAVIGQVASEVDPGRALECVAGYCVANDVRALELDGAPIGASLGRSGDTFKPLGPALVTVDEIPDPEDLGVRTTRSGEVVQSTRTKALDVSGAISRIARLVTLEPGDLVLLALPFDSGGAPPQDLRDGEVLEVEIERLGRLVSHVRRR